MSNETKERLTFSFKIKNCEEKYYYQICVNSKEEEEEYFETEKILSSGGGDEISFLKKMNYNFTFEKRQQISIIIKKEQFYSKENNIKGNERYKYLASLVMEKGGIYERKITDDYNSEIIYIKLEKDKSEIEKKYLFDYLKSGIRLSCFISFDFSKSVTEETKETNKNILKYIFRNLEIYTKEKYFYPSGFGAKIKESSTPVFNITKTNVNSDVLLEKYKLFLESSLVLPEEKILLSPLLKKLTGDVNNLFDSKVYYISFILLSQNIDENDKKKIINNIISSGYLPLSIIVIGIGDHDFSATKKILENDKKYSYQGMEKNRNNVIFTILKEHSSASETIAFCLRKLRKQIIEFYELIKYVPVNDEKKNKEVLDRSFSVYRSFNGDKNFQDVDPAPTSINPYIKTKSMPTEENKINIEGSNQGSYISEDIFHSNNNNINSINSNIHSSHESNNINISNNSNGKYSLKSSIESGPMTPNPYSFNNFKKDEEKNKSSQIKGMENNSGGIQYISTKGSDLKNSDEK